MKKFILTAACTALLLTGCAGSKPASQEPKAVCFAVANTANSQGLNLGSTLVQDTVRDTIEGYGCISVVNIDGSPEVIFAESFDIPEQYKQASAQKLKADAQANAAGFLVSLGGVIADDPEVDYLEGLRLAVRSMDSMQSGGDRTIVMLGTGLSTAGTLNFGNNLLSAEPEVLVQMLAERKEIPDLTGIRVVWQQLGDVAAPQKPLSQSQRLRLQEIWQGIVERGGGSFQCSDMMAVPAAGADYPAVSVVELAPEAPIAFAPEEIPEAAPLSTPIMLTEEQVTFVGDRADYLRPKEAEETITPIAEMLQRNPEITILLVGTTAGDATNAYTLKLSQSRAETVRDTLIALGISGDRIQTLGMGASDPWHISGAGTEGSFAAANRKVVILDAASETAKELVKNEE